MSETAKFKLNLKTGEVEIEGSEEFVERQVQALQSLVELMDLHHSPGETFDTGTSSEVSTESQPDTATTPNDATLPSSFGEWMHSFRTDLNDQDKALITARYVQSQAATNDFKTSEINNSLRDHGVKLANPSEALKRLSDKKLIFQTRKVGKLRYMRVSVDGQKHLESLKR